MQVSRCLANRSLTNISWYHMCDRKHRSGFYWLYQCIKFETWYPLCDSNNTYIFQCISLNILTIYMLFSCISISQNWSYSSWLIVQRKMMSNIYSISIDFKSIQNHPLAFDFTKRLTFKYRVHIKKHKTNKFEYALIQFDRNATRCHSKHKLHT